LIFSLKSKRAADVAYNLPDIFFLLGAPHILQSDNGREFTANIITELRSLWQELVLVHGRPRHPQSQDSVERANADIKEMIISWMNDHDTPQWSEGLRFVQFQKNRSHHRVIDQPPYTALLGADQNNGLSSSSIPKELLSQLETEEDLEQILADAGEGDTTDDTTDDDESAISTDISEADTDSNILSAEALQSTSSLATTEIAPNNEETPVVQILNPNNSDNDVQLVEPVKDTATSEIASNITETPIQHA
jgi:hypothetical protein